MIGTSIDLAVSYLLQGKIVAFPTETYYGLAVDPENDEAVFRLYQIKRRQSEKPLLLLIANLQQLATLTTFIPDEYDSLIENHWPGPLTLVFKASNHVNRCITGGTGTIGARISPNPVATQLIKRFGKPITATSANISGREPASTAEEVEHMFAGAIDYVFDGGTARGGLCSTIVGLHKGRLKILREGAVSIPG